MKAEFINLYQIRQMGIEILNREMGPVAMIRFFQQYESGSGDYTAERHLWLDNMTVEDIAEKARNLRKKIGTD